MDYVNNAKIDSLIDRFKSKYLKSINKLVSKIKFWYLYSEIMIIIVCNWYQIIETLEDLRSHLNPEYITF